MRYYIIAGEASGDLHGANLMRSLKKYDSQASFRFLGGDLMAEHGGEPVKHYREMAYMGLDVFLHLPAILANLKNCKKDILQWNPDVLILIDYPGFNLRMAKFAHKNGIKVFYYISPKVWAWKESRVNAIKQYVDKLFVIFPFEVDYFKKFGIIAEYFGNPLNDSIHYFNSQKEDFGSFIDRNNLEQKPIIALVAGSRVSEISKILPEMIKAVEGLNEYQIIVTGAPSISAELYKSIIHASNIKVLYGQTYQVMAHAKAAIVTSGTATLETALLRTPQVVVFKTNYLAYHVGKRLVRIPFFSLVNIIAGCEIVKEILQINVAQEARTELSKILNNTEYRKQILNGYEAIAQLLGEPGTADRVAEKMVKELINCS